MPTIDLTPFGFTQTESLVYQVLLTGGPGTGYAIARSAGLARANAYGALEGLVTKGAARTEGTRPKRFRPEPPAALIARISSEHGSQVEQLRRALAEVSVPASASLVEIETTRGTLQLLSHDIGRATGSVRLLAPAEAYPILTPSLRRAAGAGVRLQLASHQPVTLPFAEVTGSVAAPEWPGEPLVSVVDDKSAIIAGRAEETVSGHWSTAPTFVAAARELFYRLAEGP